MMTLMVRVMEAVTMVVVLVIAMSDGVRPSSFVLREATNPNQYKTSPLPNLTHAKNATDKDQ